MMIIRCKLLKNETDLVLSNSNQANTVSPLILIRTQEGWNSFWQLKKLLLQHTQKDQLLVKTIASEDHCTFICTVLVRISMRIWIFKYASLIQVELQRSLLANYSQVNTVLWTCNNLRNTQQVGTRLPTALKMLLYHNFYFYAHAASSACMS